MLHWLLSLFLTSNFKKDIFDDTCQAHFLAILLFFIAALRQISDFFFFLKFKFANSLCLLNSMLADKLNMSPEEAERWIVNLICNARLDAKIDSKLVRPFFNYLKKIFLNGCNSNAFRFSSIVTKQTIFKVDHFDWLCLSDQNGYSLWQCVEPTYFGIHITAALCNQQITAQSCRIT